MPNARLERTRATLPSEYQYGDQRFLAEAHDMAEDGWFRDTSGQFKIGKIGDRIIVHFSGIPSHVKGHPCEVCDRASKLIYTDRNLGR